MLRNQLKDLQPGADRMLRFASHLALLVVGKLKNGVVYFEDFAKLSL